VVFLNLLFPKRKKTREEREVRTSPEARKESGSHIKSTRELYPGK